MGIQSVHQTQSLSFIWDEPNERNIPGRSSPHNCFIHHYSAREMAVRRINAHLRRLDFLAVDAALYSAERADSDPGFEVWEASIDEWETYVRSENQAIKSRGMSWRDGKIYIVEPSSEVHQMFCALLDEEVMAAAGTRFEHLQPKRSTYVERTHRLLEPDCSYGPRGPSVAMRSAGVQLPAGVTPGEYHTLKVEVGVARSWYQLEERANEWKQFPGVEYVLCIFLTLQLERCEFKLFSVADNANFVLFAPMDPIGIVGPATLVELESRRLLGLPPDGEIPRAFIQPYVVVDLYSIAESLREELAD
ncbi:hypothetical protein FI667_g8197, partial [Globisporangium splendens]